MPAQLYACLSVTAPGQIRTPKTEVRNNSEVRRLNVQEAVGVGRMRRSGFGVLSGFDFRTSTTRTCRQAKSCDGFEIFPRRAHLTLTDRGWIPVSRFLARPLRRLAGPAGGRPRHSGCAGRKHPGGLSLSVLGRRAGRRKRQRSAGVRARPTASGIPLPYRRKFWAQAA